MQEILLYRVSLKKKENQLRKLSVLLVGHPVRYPQLYSYDSPPSSLKNLNKMALFFQTCFDAKIPTNA